MSRESSCWSRRDEKTLSGCEEMTATGMDFVDGRRKRRDTDLWRGRGWFGGLVSMETAA